MEETFEQTMERVKSAKKKKRTINLHIKDCPISLYEKFVCDIHLYNDLYWAKFQDLLRKAEFYDNVNENGVEHLTEEVSQEPEQDSTIETKEDELMTIGDMKEARKLKEVIENERTNRKQ